MARRKTQAVDAPSVKELSAIEGATSEIAKKLRKLLTSTVASEANENPWRLILTRANELLQGQGVEVFSWRTGHDKMKTLWFVNIDMTQPLINTLLFDPEEKKFSVGSWDSVRNPRRTGGEIENPRAAYKPEKGPPVRKDSGWFDPDSDEDLSNTYWTAGIVDYSGRTAKVTVDDPELDSDEWESSRSSGEKRLITYLLHPDKWAQTGTKIKAARGFIPNVSAAPSQPLGYALTITYDVPVKLSSKPGLAKNPRAWFESWGEATALRKIGDITITSTGRKKPVYEEIVIHERGAGPRGGVKLG